MKKIQFSIIAVLMLLAIGLNAQTPLYNAVSLTASLPATLATTAGTNLVTPAIIDCRAQQNVAVSIKFTQTSASTSNVLYYFQPSVNGSDFDTNKTMTATVTSTGASPQIFTTNFNVQGYGFLRLYAISNNTALTTWTNLGVTYGLKLSSP